MTIAFSKAFDDCESFRLICKNAARCETVLQEFEWYRELMKYEQYVFKWQARRMAKTQRST